MIRSTINRRGFLRALAGSAVLAGCSPLTVVNGLVPSGTYRATKDLHYGQHPRQALDVYQPASTTTPRPVVIFFYGGNWNAGARGGYLFAGEALASKDIVAVIPDYRLYPEVRFPDFLHDCAAAVRWTFEHIAEFGGDPSRVFLMGHSAGAYNAAMLALDPEYLRAANVDRRRIRGLIGLAGPYDFLPLTGEITKAVFGFPDTAPTTQPIHFASAGDPPALLVTGDADHTVDPGNSARLAARLRKSGVPVQEIVYPGVSHTRLVGALAAPFRRVAPVLEDVAAFVNTK
jgi:acetyl esterase/lipase